MYIDKEESETLKQNVRCKKKKELIQHIEIAEAIYETS